MRTKLLLLPFVLANYASALLPNNPGVFNEIDFSSTGALQKASNNAFTAWVAALPLDGTGLNFKMGNSNPVGIVAVTRITGYDANCVVGQGQRYDVCASSVESPSPSSRVLKIYTQVKTSWNTIESVPLAQEIQLQNIMIRAVGRLFGMSWNTSDVASVMSDKFDGSYTYWGTNLYIRFPTTSDANQVRALYGIASPFSPNVDLKPIALMETKDVNGALVSGGYRRGVINEAYPGSLKQLRWIVASEMNNIIGTKLSTVTVGGRIRQDGAPSCYSVGQDIFGVTGSVTASINYSSPISQGAHMTEMFVESLTKYDLITSQHPGTANCQRAGGRGLDAWGELYW